MFSTPGGAAKTEPQVSEKALQSPLPNTNPPVPPCARRIPPRGCIPPLSLSQLRWPRHRAGPEPCSGADPSSESCIVCWRGLISPLVCLFASSGVSLALPVLLDARSSSRVAALIPARTMERAAVLAAPPCAGDAAGEGTGTGGCCLDAFPLNAELGGCFHWKMPREGREWTGLRCSCCGMPLGRVDPPQQGS